MLSLPSVFLVVYDCPGSSVIIETLPPDDFTKSPVFKYMPWWLSLALAVKGLTANFLFNILPSPFSVVCVADRAQGRDSDAWDLLRAGEREGQRGSRVG